MKVTIEKKITTLTDLRLAKAHLQKSVAKKEAKILRRSKETFQELSFSRVYNEALDSFGIDNLITQILPYLLKAGSAVSDTQWAQKISKGSKIKFALITGLLAAIGIGGYLYFNKKNENPDTDTSDEDEDDINLQDYYNAQ
ncbi:MAG: hypothetical protein RIS47_924 [Bacteroidota bacterium]|jgi:predicted negative regulator of RcsB-dependent stress response